MKEKFRFIVELIIVIVVLILEEGGATLSVNDPFRERCLSQNKLCIENAACTPAEHNPMVYECQCANGWEGDGAIGCSPPNVFLSLSPDMECDQSTINTCFMTSEVGKTASMSVEPHGKITDTAWQITWYKIYAGLPPLYHSFQEKIESMDSLENRMEVDDSNSVLTIYEIRESDIYPNRFIAEITTSVGSSPAVFDEGRIAPYDITELERLNPSVIRVYFMIEEEPIEISPNGPGIIDLDEYIPPSVTLSDHSLSHYRWASEGDVETLARHDHILHDETEKYLSLSHLDDGELNGVLRGMAFGRNGRVPGRVLLASARFRLKEDQTKICTGPLSERVCTCRIGYTLNGTQCVDIDECNSFIPYCLPTAICVNDDGSFHCQCPEGYTGDGVTFCSDIDECMTGDRCHPSAVCSNTPGSFVCTCVEGYVGDGLDCSAVSSWTEWSSWSPCVESCGESTRERIRECSHPESGMICFGAPREREDCLDNPPCPVHGGWSEWSMWSSCSSSCDGQRQRVRVCDNPTPEFGGLFCDGDMYTTDMCGDLTCPVPGDWGSWEEWSECSRACDGTQVRYRPCEPRRKPAGRPPVDEGLCPTGNKKESRTCSLEDDEVFCSHGNVHVGKIVSSPEWSRWSMWNEWTHWSYCSLTCGEGRRYRRRSCKTKTSGHAADVQRCEGDHREMQPCFERPCSETYPLRRYRGRR